MNFNKLVYFLFLINVSKFSFSQLTKCKLQIKYIGDRMINRQTDRQKENFQEPQFTDVDRSLSELTD